MKFRLTFKTPDVLHYARQEIRSDNPEMDAEEIESEMEFLNDYITWGEYLYVDVDTELKTLTVVPK
jgi:hypothetical protein